MKKHDPWIIKAFLLTFFITLIVSGGSNIVLDKCPFILIVLTTILIIFIGILFDIIGTSVLTANEANFHAMASSKIKGAKTGIKLIKNSSNIANFCNDTIGDICGILSGSMGLIIALNLANLFNISSNIFNFLIASIISSLTVGFKAIGKKYATKNSDKIIFFVGKFLSNFIKEK